MKYNGFSLDLESNGFIFESKVIWVMCLKDLDSEEKLKLNFFNDKKAKDKFLSWLDRYEKPNISFHNGLGFDIFVMLFVGGVKYTVGPDTLEGRDVNFVDTFYLSMFLNPDREKHSIEYFGRVLGYPKMDFRQASIDAGIITKDSEDGAEFQQHSELMDKYCGIDAEISDRTFKYLIDEWCDIYGKFDGWTPAFKSGQKSFYLMSCQELSGWKFDIEGAKALEIRIKSMMEELRASVEPKLPPRSLKKTEAKDYKMPAKPWKTNGEFSAQWEKFVAKHNAKLTEAGWEFYGEVVEVKADKILDVKLPMQMGNQEQMKEWFLQGRVKTEYENLYENIEWIGD